MDKDFYALRFLRDYVLTYTENETDRKFVFASCEELEKELKALEIIRKYQKWKGSIKYLLYMSNYWKENNKVITNELLEDYDFPFEIEEFNLLSEVFTND